MHSVLLLQKQLEGSLFGIHKRSRDAVWRAVAGLATAGRLWLTALGRSLPGATSDKNRIKAADRMLGSRSVQNAVLLFYRALAKRLLRRTHRPIIAIDGSILDAKHYVLSAQLCWDGRSLPLYQQVFPRAHFGNQQLHEQFLVELGDVIPNHCRPIIVSDAGYRTPWFNAVAEFGWDYVGRIRDKTDVLFEGSWTPVKKLFELAGSKPRDLGLRLFPRTRRNARMRRLVLSKRHRSKGRKRKTRSGGPGRSTADRRGSVAAREPWLLVTSLTCNCKFVVHAYSMRMQIEQSFRDAKNHRHGWSLNHVRCGSAKRLHVLLLIADIAAVVVQIVGWTAASLGLQRHFQANTVTRRRVLSFFVLGRHAIRREVSFSATVLIRTLGQFAARVALNGLFAARK